MIPIPVPAGFDSYTPFLLVFAGLVLLSLLMRAVPALRGLLSLVLLGLFAWSLVTLVGERGQFDPALGRLAAWMHADEQQVQGGEVRIRMAPDGHFWADVRLNGVRRRLVDSGATVTALSPGTAAAAGLEVRDPVFPVLLHTANGTIPARTAKLDRLRLGAAAANGLTVVVSPAFGDTDVLGMNFLSMLQSWRVEGRTLILVPHHPQPVDTAA
jgi:aspartyl protease family protein